MLSLRASQRLGVPPARCCCAANSSSIRSSSSTNRALRPRQGVAVRYKGQADTEEALRFERLPYDCTELLDLHGQPSFLLCDVTKAYDTLRSMPLIEGYSPAAVEGRDEVLAYAKDLALDAEGAVAPGGARGIDLPLHVLPSALALLAQLEQNVSVYELGERLLASPALDAAAARDVVLSLVVAHCNIARDLLEEQKVAEGCCVLEEGLARLQAAGAPPLAPRLAADIQAAIGNLLVHRLRDQFRDSTVAFEASERARAVALMRGALLSSSASAASSASSGAVSSSSAGVSGGHAIREAARRAVADDVLPDLLSEVVAHLDSHEVVAMADWAAVARKPGGTTWLYPGLLQTAAAAHLATAVTQQRVQDAQTALALAKAAPSSAEVLLLRGVAHMLLGNPPAAAAAIKAAASAQPDRTYQLPAGGVSLQELEAGGSLLLPLPSRAHEFVGAHSRPDDEPALLTGLFVYASTFLQQAVLPGFPDTVQLPGAASLLAAYLEAPGVQQQLLQVRGASTSLAGGLDAVKDALASVQHMAQQLAAAASSRLPGTGASSSQSSSQQQRSRVASAGAAIDDLTQGLQQRLGGRGPAAAAVLGGAALAAALLATVLGRSGAARAPALPQHQPLTTAAFVHGDMAAAAVRPLTKGSATALLRRFQAAKAAALGSNYDAAPLAGVCCGPALARFQGMSADWAARGWFRTSSVWKTDVTRVAPLSASGLRVLISARLGEQAETWGIDGQRGSSWSNEYDVDYEVVLCRDLVWRVERVTVRGQEPGMGGGGWLSGLLGGGGGGGGRK